MKEREKESRRDREIDKIERERMMWNFEKRRGECGDGRRSRERNLFYKKVKCER